MTANAGQCRPTAANKGQCRPTKNRYVFFCNVHFIFYFLITTKQLRLLRSNYKAHEGPQQPTTANAGQRRPTAANEGQCRPTKNRYVFFCNVHFIFHFSITTKQLRLLRSNYKAHEGPQQPTTANAGQRRPTAANEGQCRPTKNRYVFL